MISRQGTKSQQAVLEQLKEKNQKRKARSPLQNLNDKKPQRALKTIDNQIGKLENGKKLIDLKKPLEVKIPSTNALCNIKNKLKPTQINILNKENIVNNVIKKEAYKISEKTDKLDKKNVLCKKPVNVEKNDKTKEVLKKEDRLKKNVTKVRIDENEKNKNDEKKVISTIIEKDEKKITLIPKKPEITQPSALRQSNSSTEEESFASAIGDSSEVVKEKNKTLIRKSFEHRVQTRSSRRFSIPEGVYDFDRENSHDIYQASEYAFDIFIYLKSRELNFKIRDYMRQQKYINQTMRTILVDWLVEVQESFELNHETLYLGVKLTDYFLSKTLIKKEDLQLVGATAMFVACKYEEKMPPMLQDFIYLCDNAFNKKSFIQMELLMLKSCSFDLGFPLSYRFLRRYSRCAKFEMKTLSLARYILEVSLMNYETVTLSDSKLACAALYIAIIMLDLGTWTKCLEYYSGYKLDEFLPEVKILNNYLHKIPQNVETIKQKYSHELFYNVAAIPLVDIK